jgi:hypothetical protein
VIVVLGIVAALSGGDGGGTGGTETQQPSSPGEASQTAAIGTPVRDGKFEFTVSKITCGRERIGTADIGKSAQGQFCLVRVKVENIGNESQLLDGSSQYLYGEGGQRYSADSEAAIYLDNAKTFLEQINPGNTVNGTLVFDVPKNAKPARIELHDSSFSGGVTINL